MVVSELFEATDDNGITVRGTVDVNRDPKGDFYNPAKPEFFGHKRFANVVFDYFNTREACTIDRNVLQKAMEDVLANALTRFGIKNPDPGRDKIAAQINQSINATRQQCTQNADKYVSNETGSSTDWETGKSVGDVTVKAYAAVSAPGGGIQAVVARENSWPADDVSTRKTDVSNNGPILSMRVIAGDGSNSVGDWSANPSPVLRALEKSRRSAAPDAAPRSVQEAAAATPAFRPDAVYSPAGDFFGNFPRVSAAGATPSSAAFSGPGSSSGP